MQYLVSAKEMKLLDQNTSLHFRVPELVLMEQAAMAFVQKLFYLESSRERQWESALILCGSGNNGADGLAVARLLAQQKRNVTVCAVGEYAGFKTTDSYRTERDICEAYQIPVVHEANPGDFDLIVDALFGIGLSRDVEGLFAEVIKKANDAGAWHVAIDISSGLSADSGTVLGTAFRADDTITFSFGKLGQFLWPGNEFSGRIHIVHMGITEESFLGCTPKVAALEQKDLRLPVRSAHSNKGTYGKLLIIAGSANMAGAACLCAHAAYRSGCGLVRVLTSEKNREILQTVVPEAILTTYEDGVHTEQIKEALNWADAVVIGPGIGTGDRARKMLSCALSYVKVPVVLDADALNILSRDTETLMSGRGKGWIVTPHLGEMSRLTDRPVASLQTSLCEAAEQFADAYGIICVLKDFHTITAVPGVRIYLNLSGNPGMATAGSGDVLAGIIGSLLAQGLAPDLAAPYGVYLHGLAGDAAVSSVGMSALMARDIVESLSAAEREVRGEESL